MTCIVAVVHKGRTWMGADSCVVDAAKGTRELSHTPKMWKAGGYLVGAAGNAGWFAVLRALQWPTVAAEGYMLTGFVRDLLSSASRLGIAMPAEEDSAGDGSALVGGAGRLWYVDSDLSVDEYTEMGCGSGGPGARSVLHVCGGSPRRRILAALHGVASVRYDVAPPFVVDSV